MAKIPYVDISEIPDDASCYVMGTNTIYAYYTRRRVEYHITNDKAYRYYTNNYNYNYDISGYSCRTYSQISEIPTSYQWIAPYTYGFACIIAIILLFIPYRIITHRFWRRL